VLRSNVEAVRRYAHLCHGDLLDIGCGGRPHEALLRGRVNTYVGLDHEATLHTGVRADVWGDATDLPFAKESFDTVVMFQTLEHIPEPALALSEAFRVMRPGGFLFITTPFMWGIHEAPYDFYRYTPFALERLVRNAGFGDFEVEPVGGYWLTAGLRFSYHLHSYSRRWLRPLFVPFQFFAQVFAMVLDRFDRDDRDATGYTTLAHKH
jgi:SAM-dependent methyltransferase